MLASTPSFPPPSLAFAQSNVLDFDGSNDRLVVPGGSGSVFDFQASDFTIELWIKTPLSGIEQTLISTRHSTSSDKLRVYINSSDQASFHVNLDDQDTVVSHPATLSADTWHHIAVVRFNNNQMNIFVDGVPGTKVKVGKTDNLADLDQDVAIGNDYNPDPSSGLGNFFTGQMDELRFWDITRNESDIQATANQELLGNETGLVAYYDFNQGVADGNNAGIVSATDRTAGGRHATIYNFALTGSSSNFLAKAGLPSQIAHACESGERLFPLENPDPGGVSGWTATASSVLTGFGGSWDSSHIVDNRVNTFWLSDTKTVDPDHYITVDMGSARTIAGVQYFYNDQNSDVAVEDFEVMISTDGTNFNSVTSGQLKTDVEAIAQHIFFESEVSARYIRLKSTSPDRVYIGGAEISPMACATSGEFVSTFTTATCEESKLNSGYDSLTGNAFDPILDRFDMQWHVAQIDNTNNTLDAFNEVAAWQKAIIIGNAQRNWKTPPPTAEWVGISHSGKNTGTVEHLYRLDFHVDMPHQDYLNILSLINFNFHSDNGIYDILVNGRSLKADGYLSLGNDKNHDGYSANSTPVSWSMDPELLRIGMNTMVLHVKSRGDYTGLLSNLSSGSSCTPIDIGSAPESYGTKEQAPVHYITGAPLYIGTAPPTPFPRDDSDGVSLKTYTGADSGKITATVTGKNATGAPAMLCGYFDGAADGVVDGSFSKGIIYVGSVGDGIGDVIAAGNEELCIQVPGSSGSHSVTLAAVPGFNGAEAVCTTQSNSNFSCDLHFYPKFTGATQTYSRFRLTSDSKFFSTSSPSPTGTASDGESEDAGIIYSPTAAVIGSVRIMRAPIGELVDQYDAEAVAAFLDSYGVNSANLPDDSANELLKETLDPDGDGTVALVHWTTLEELGTAGFFLSRREAERGEWIRINNKMLPGLIDAPLGGEYLYADPGALPGVDYLYRLTEQEAWGSQREYGPYQLRY